MNYSNLIKFFYISIVLIGIIIGSARFFDERNSIYIYSFNI